MILHPLEFVSIGVLIMKRVIVMVLQNSMFVLQMNIVHTCTLYNDEYCIRTLTAYHESSESHMVLVSHMGLPTARDLGMTPQVVAPISGRFSVFGECRVSLGMNSNTHVLKLHHLASTAA